MANFIEGNLKADGSIDYDEKGCAMVIVRSWIRKSPDEAKSYVANLPSGRKKVAFESALAILEPRLSSKSRRTNP